MHNGGHIAPDIMPRLFEPFQSGVGKRKRAEGLGLGLYIVQQIVASMVARSWSAQHPKLVPRSNSSTAARLSAFELYRQLAR